MVLYLYFYIYGGNVQGRLSTCKSGPVFHWTAKFNISVLAAGSLQVALNCQLLSSGVSSVGVCEVILGRDVTVRECRCVMVTTLGLSGELELGEYPKLHPQHFH